MPRAAKTTASPKDSSAHLGFEAKLWLAADEADFGPEHADTFRRDLHPDLRADYALERPTSRTAWSPSPARSSTALKFPSASGFSLARAQPKSPKCLKNQ